MDYGRIISRGWEIVWKNKFMFVLGFLAALAGGMSSGGSSNTNFTVPSDDLTAGQLPPFVQDGPMADFLADPNWPAIAAAVGAGVMLLLCILLIISIVLWFIGNTARAGLIYGTATIEGGGETRFGEAFRNGWTHIWRILGMKIAIFVAMFVIIGALVAIPIGLIVGSAISEEGGAIALAVLCLCFALIVIIALSLVVTFIDAMAYRGIVLGRMGVFESLRHGWAIARSNFVNLFLLSVIFFVIGILVWIVTGLVMAPIAAITGFTAFDAITEGTFSVANGVLIGITLLLFTVVAAVVNSALVAWRSSSFTLAYLDFTGGTPEVGVEKEKGPDDLKTA